MSEKQSFSETDLQVGTTGRIDQAQDVFVHTHTVLFDRALSQAERHLFASVLTGFYYTVHFSHQFGNGLVAEPIVEFEAPDRARYTLKQTALNGPWKDLLFTILANFSKEVAPIRRHDESRAFDPERAPA